MGCIFLLIAALSPRLAVLLMWIFTPWVDRAFGPIIWPILGVLFLPITTLLYVILWNTNGRGVNGWEWLLVILGVVCDLGSYAGGRYGRPRAAY
jgi:CDP-diglyceride synthetase